MRDLTKQELKIIEPLKTIVSEDFYNSQVEAMKGIYQKPNEHNLTAEQIAKCQKIRQELIDYQTSFKSAIDMINEGTAKLNKLLH